MITPNPPALADLYAGAPCWAELPVTDLAATTDFYTGLFGWEFVDDRGYTVATLDGVPVAGLPHGTALPEQYTAWTLFLHTRHARATAEKVFALGGQVLRNPTPAIDHTQSTVVLDPTGAVIGFRHVPPDWRFGTTGHGAFAWAELNTRDGAAADAFFKELCHFDVMQIGDGHTVDYTVWSVDGKNVLGRQRMGRRLFPSDVPAHWMVYFTAAPEIGADSVANRVLELGGRITVEPYDTPYGRVTEVQDHAGEAFSVIDSSRAVPLTDDDRGSEVDDPYDD
ncbi:VOC family protein [Umezawaea sp. Da 62-37]|uniref:VOC family protein n=1 Tax=Umezawaea sp. Da 62-37 TaxID=3075927 RepID=UPI0028F6F03C|nr:VOC family protein [Umezawaea sp. Da 62-37]WNV89872.1 VOC family protein [Umezawaea sp. Da 62-37]